MVQRAAAVPAVNHRISIGRHHNASSLRLAGTPQHIQHRITRIATQFRQVVPQQTGVLAMLYAYGLMTVPPQPRTGPICNAAGSSPAEYHGPSTVQQRAPTSHLFEHRVAPRVVRAIPRRVIPFADRPDWTAIATLPRSAGPYAEPPASAADGFHSGYPPGGRAIPPATELTRKDMPPLALHIIPIRPSDNLASSRPLVSVRSVFSDSRIERQHRQRSASAVAAIAGLNGEVRDLLLLHPDIVSCCQAGMMVADLIAAAITFSRSSNVAHASLARVLQKVSGDYGAHVGEPMSIPVQRKIIHHWIVLNLFGQSMGAWAYEKILDTENAVHLRTGDFCRLVLQQAFGTEHVFHAYRRQILTQVLREELPLLACFNEHNVGTDAACKRFTEMKLDDFEWGQLHAGQRFAQSMGLGGKFDLDESVQLGEVLLIQLRAGVVPNAWWEFFRLPAIMRYAHNNPEVLRNATLDGEEDIGDEEIIARALVDYAFAYERGMEEKFPIAKFKYRMDHFRTRPQLARHEIEVRCSGMLPASYLDNPDSSTCINRRVPGRAAAQTIALPDINAKFKAQINELAELYQRIDKAFLSVACNVLADDDFEHISQSEVRWASVTYSAADVLNKVPFVGANHHARESLTLYPMPGVEFLVTKSVRQAERIYALQRKGLEYVLLRVDRNIRNYYSLFTQNLGKISNPDFKLKVNAVRGSLKTEKDDLSVLLEHILTKNRQEFAGLLYIHGYEETTSEMAWRMVKSMIPFYTCVNAIQDDKPDEAVLSCPLDMLSLAPAIAAFSRLSLKLGQIAGSGSLIAARNAANGIALRNALQVVLQQAVTDLAQYAMLPAAQAVNRKTLARLGLATLRSLDPGIELLGSIGVASVSQSIRIGRAMSMQSRRLKDVFSRLETALPRLPAGVNQNDYASAILPGLDQPVTIIRLGGDRLNGQDVYVRLHPESGQPFGRKYVRLPDGTLDPIPVALAQRLKNVLEQGLGGKGGARQGVAWGKGAGPLPADVNRWSPQSPQSPPSPQSPQASGSVASLLAPAVAGTSRQAAALAAHATDLHDAGALRQIENMVRQGFQMDGGQIYFRKDRRCEYHLDWDVFIETDTKSILAPDAGKGGIVRMSPRQAEARVASVTFDQRTAVLRALGIDLDVGAILQAPIPVFGSGRALAKKISYVWVGDQPISQMVMDTMAVNRDVASQAGYQMHFYLSVKSFDVNYAKLKQILCSNDNCLPSAVVQHKIQLLETTDFYEQFRISRNFAQYQDAIEGNGGIATNYASAADILRLALLKYQGGLYMDVDDTLLPELGKLDLKADTHGMVLGGLLSSESLGMDFAFGTSFFGAQPDSMVLDKILEEIAHRYQLDEYRLFYKEARPLATDSEAINVYAQKLLHLTGPGVFNSVVVEQLPAVKNFVGLARLIEISSQPEYSELIEKLTQRIASEEDICPLSAAHTIGSMNSWLHHR